MINRALAPENHKLSQPGLLHPVKIKALSGTTIYAFNSPGCKVVQLELVFSGGQLNQKKPLQSSFTAQMMSEGTKSFEAKKIASTIDFFGASFQIDSDMHNHIIAIGCTRESLEKLIPVINEIATVPLFSEKEFAIQLNSGRERFKVNIQKVDYIARQQFNASLYGPESVLGKPVVLEDYDSIAAADLKLFFSTVVDKKLEHVIASGDLDKQTLELITNFISGLGHLNPPRKTPIPISIPKTNKQFFEVKNAMQNGIRIGFSAIPRQHDDYPALQVANMILGGYFGSRLMSNIREDKGYTYGIGSSVVPLADSGYLVIATEVGTNVTQAALDEIHKEIKLLCTVPVEKDELELARNYLIGSFIRNSDGVFAMADRLKALLYSDLDYAYYDHYFNVIENITSQEIMKVAKEYLDRPYIEVVAGGKN
jgi:zinc protease